MNYKILLIFVITVATATTTATLSLAIYISSNAFAINENSVNPPSTSSSSSFALSTDNNSSTIKNNDQNYNSTNKLENTSQLQQNNLLITKLLAKNLENHIQKAGAILEITSKLPQVQNVPYANLLNQTLNTLHGIPQNADIEKRQVAKSIISNYNDFQIVIFIMSNGDIYFDEPYPRQQISTISNLAFRDYFQGAIKTNDVFLGDPTTSASSGQMQSVIAVPVYSLKDNSTVVGVWAGGLDFNVLNKELQSFNFTTSTKDNSNMRVVYVGHLGQKIADSDINKSKTPESFASLQSFKNAINGQSGSIVDTVDNTKKMLVTYQPVKAFHNTFAILLMQPLQQ